MLWEVRQVSCSLGQTHKLQGDLEIDLLPLFLTCWDLQAITTTRTFDLYATYISSPYTIPMQNIKVCTRITHRDCQLKKKSIRKIQKKKCEDPFFNSTPNRPNRVYWIKFSPLSWAWKIFPRKGTQTVRRTGSKENSHCKYKAHHSAPLPTARACQFTSTHSK